MKRGVLLGVALADSGENGGKVNHPSDALLNDGLNH